MTHRLVFAALYLRNLFSFGWSHPHAVAATRMDMALRQRRKQKRGAP